MKQIGQSDSCEKFKHRVAQVSNDFSIPGVLHDAIYEKFTLQAFWICMKIVKFSFKGQNYDAK